MVEANLNILSQRYATPEMNQIFSEKGKILSERELWIAVMKILGQCDKDIVIEVKKYRDKNFNKIYEANKKLTHK